MTEIQSKDQETKKREKRKKRKKEERGEKRDRENKGVHVPRDLTLMVTQFHGNQLIYHNNDTGPLMRLEPL